MSGVPNPGSDEAVARGCTCPVMDNARSRGRPYRGSIEFWINGDCPIHAIEHVEPRPHEEAGER